MNSESFLVSWTRVNRVGCFNSGVNPPFQELRARKRAEMQSRVCVPSEKERTPVCRYRMCSDARESPHWSRSTARGHLHRKSTLSQFPRNMRSSAKTIGAAHRFAALFPSLRARASAHYSSLCMIRHVRRGSVVSITVALGVERGLSQRGNSKGKATYIKAGNNNNALRRSFIIYLI